MQVIAENEKNFELLFDIQNNNPTSKAVLLPSHERVFDINLSERTIDTPDVVTVQSDHDAETIYFKTSRYFDNVDLTNLVCVIHYVTKNGKSFVYAVPYYDVDQYSTYDKDGVLLDEPKILFPWRISGLATELTGPVAFSVRFFKLDSSGTAFIYNLSTLPSTLVVSEGLKLSKSHEGMVPDNTSQFLASQWEQILDEMKKTSDTSGTLYWVQM